MRDEASFAAFVAARGPALARLAYLFTADRDLAEDLLQTALHKTALRWSRIRPEAREAYLRTALYHDAVSSWRRRRRRREITMSTVPDRAVVSGSDGVDERVVLQRALARLTPRQRAVLVLRFYEDMSEAQVADALGVSVGTVKSQTRHSLDRLRELAPELAEFVRGEATP